MKTQTKRPIIRPGDLAYVAYAGLGEIPLYRIVSIETDADGEIARYFVTDQSRHDAEGSPVEAKRVLGVFRNVLNQE